MAHGMRPKPGPTRTNVERDHGVKIGGRLVWRAGKTVDCMLCEADFPVSNVEALTVFIRVNVDGAPALRPIGKATFCRGCVELVRRREGPFAEL